MRTDARPVVWEDGEGDFPSYPIEKPASDRLSAGRQRTSTERSEVDERATGVARLPLEPADVPAPSTELRSSERAQGGDEAAGGRRPRREAAIVRERSQPRPRLFPRQGGAGGIPQSR